MEIQDLMIGDWVLDGNHIAQVVLLTCDGIIETTFNESSNIEVVEPIPLTTEILEKNGFYYDEDRKAYLMGVIFQVKPEKHGLFSFKICGCPYPLSAVHELQHALKLCGIDKEIVL